jgi:hypothetical protein
VAKKQYKRLYMTGISTPVKNGSMELSGSSQTAVRDWYLNTGKEWFHGAIRKLTDGST